MKMNRFFLSFILSFSLLPFASAQITPDWVHNKGESLEFPESRYLTGFGMSMHAKNEDLEQVKEAAFQYAKTSMTEKVNVKVQSNTVIHSQSSDMAFSESVDSYVNSQSTIEVQGLKTSYFYDKKKKIQYAFVYANKAKVVEYYQTKFEAAQTQQKGLYEEGLNYASGEQRERAEDAFLKASNALSDILEMESILYGLGFPPTEKKYISQIQIQKALDDVINQPIMNTDQLAHYLAYCLNGQYKDHPLTNVVISPLTYQDTEMSSKFSKFFKTALENELISTAKWSFVQFTDYTQQINNADFKYALRGTYWVSDHEIKFNVFVQEIKSGEKICAISKSIPKAIIETLGLQYTPTDFKQKQKEMDAFKASEFAANGIQLDTWTNKGKEDLIFTNGEAMKLYVKVNVPCYVRVVYHLADGQRVHFFDEYINTVNAGEIYELPYEFECQEPFGVEMLQVNAQEDPFEALTTKEEHGYHFITDDLETIVVKSRGFGVKKKVFKAEKRLVITTMQ